MHKADSLSLELAQRGGIKSDRDGQLNAWLANSFETIPTATTIAIL